MPRIPTSVLVEAYQENALLPLILKECRTLGSARNELRWLRERALRDSQSRSRQANASAPGWRTRLRSMCYRRSRGVPLQYILGDQPFGDLEILCRRGVLIPRPDTECFTYQAAKLAQRIALSYTDKHTPSRQTRPLRVLDLCTGTGCIALLLHSLLAPHFDQLRILGIDKSPIALSLALRNIAHNRKLGRLDSRVSTDVQFQRADVLSQGAVEKILPQKFPTEASSDRLAAQAYECDLLISNPPYISHSDFRNGTTTRSVRLFEPREALVPQLPHVLSRELDHPEDIFYHRILSLSLQLRSRITVLECGDIMQARRVIAVHNTMASQHGDAFKVEIWPSSPRDLEANGFHPQDGARAVIIQRHI